MLLPLSSARADGTCAVEAPQLGVDVASACATVLAAVPGWDGHATVTVVEGDSAVAAESVGDTVSVHRTAWAALTPEGKRVVLTHELVHVATDAFTTARTPMWLVEGYADAVALRGSALPDRVAAQELAADVARGVVPMALPSSKDFAAQPAQAYEGSWLAVDLLLSRYGDSAVLALYRDAGRTGTVDVKGLLTDWRVELVRRLS